MADKKIRLLVVDPLEVWRKVIINHISQTDDIELAGETSNGREAIFMIDEIHPNIVMLNVSINDIASVKEIIINIRKINPEVKIIFCVDSNRKEDILSGLDIDVFDFVTKPYQKQILLRAIRECMTHPV